MKSFMTSFFLLLLLLFTWSVRVYHIGVYPKPNIPLDQYSLDENSPLWKKGQWIDKSVLGVHQLVVTGSPFERGLIAGHFVHHLMNDEEQELNEHFNKFFPNELLRRAFIISLIRWFWGIEKYFEPSVVEEMYGVSQFSGHQFDFLADPLTRQIAYHGLHEVGQMMVDQKGDDMGCTVVALPGINPASSRPPAWVIGRNFDFEGGKIFDSEKIMKWVFPDQGYAFVSVIWAGMVGAVTGVNEHGVYISINAAGTTDFSRFGTPSTLVLMKALQTSKTADQAVQVIQDSHMFITDLFVVSDRTTGKLYRVEKSPKNVRVLELTTPSIVTNHLLSPLWKDDKINSFRRDELTSTFRLNRGEALLKTLEPTTDSHQLEQQALQILRDKDEGDGHPLHLGNRRAIDALIATHSVIYNEQENILFVNQGPSVSGRFIGFDLKESFRNRTPTVARELPRDPLVTDETYANVKLADQTETAARNLIQKGNCSEADTLLQKAKALYGETYTYYTAYGDLLKCNGDLTSAKEAWRKALSLFPAYPREVKDLERKLQ